ncbi:acetyl-CoA hydrolase/transferase C-terminal domain-containing protein [Paracoccus sp. (in: a-proteobacteria)]|uniref:acetyl-CoA hydrolase/transferase C-terminal domain-containing protein n=1 Tax=Paracoccus sp. TaxID=267 RepID=UPI003A8C4704
MPARISSAGLDRVLPKRGLVWISGCSGESDAFRDGLAGLSRPGLTFVSVLVPGLNRPSYLLETGARVVTFFMLPELAGAAPVKFLPLPYREIGLWLTRNPPSAALIMVSAPDRDGRCSLGAVTDFAADILTGCDTIIAHVNPRMPATRGTPGIAFDRLSAVIEAPQDLRSQDPGSDPVAEAIARNAAALIPDGVTLQAGIGRVPEAVLRGLTGKRGLAIHSGLIGDSTLHLLRAGALRADNPVTAGVAIGTSTLYDAISAPDFTFRPPSFTHDLAVLAGIDRLVTINSATELDLDGQVHAEATPKGPFSGPGGASDFAAGARGTGGLRIIALPATAARGTVSRIVRARDACGPVSLGRFDTDVVITEHGAADLRCLSPKARRAALTAIAAPEHRAALSGP